MSAINSNTASSVQNQSVASSVAKSWMAVFPLAAIALSAVQVSAAATLCLAAALTVTMAGIAQASVSDVGDDGRFDAKQRLISFLAPVQFALLLWLAVCAGRALAGSLASSSAAAFAIFALLVAADFALSAVTLLAAEHGRGISGLSLASLISSKYAGLLGRII